MDNEEYLEVEGNPDLVRTPSRAIVNTNRSEYEEFIERRRKQLLEKKRLEDLEEKVDSLENKLDTIIGILTNK